MSRTKRRNKKELIDLHCGSYEENMLDTWWLNYRYPNLTPDQAYEKMVARYTRDHHRGHFGVPHWYRRLHGSLPMRRSEDRKIQRHLIDDSWDNHLPENRVRNKKRFF